MEKSTIDSKQVWDPYISCVPSWLISKAVCSIRVALSFTCVHHKFRIMSSKDDQPIDPLGVARYTSLKNKYSSVWNSSSKAGNFHRPNVQRPGPAHLRTGVNFLFGRKYQNTTVCSNKWRFSQGIGKKKNASHTCPIHPVWVGWTLRESGRVGSTDREKLRNTSNQVRFRN